MIVRIETDLQFYNSSLASFLQIGQKFSLFLEIIYLTCDDWECLRYVDQSYFPRIFCSLGGVLSAPVGFIWCTDFIILFVSFVWEN